MRVKVRGRRSFTEPAVDGEPAEKPRPETRRTEHTETGLTEPLAGGWFGVTEASVEDPAAIVERLTHGRPHGSRTPLPEEGTMEVPVRGG